jgi:hypothetical protein
MTAPSWFDFRFRVRLMAGLAIAAAGAMFSVPRFTDPPWYYDFADRRTIRGIPNFMDVVSNAPWAVVGIVGLLFLWRKRASGPGSPFTEDWERGAFAVLFAAIGLVALGSAWFHLAPTPATLVWDRLPMALIFMSVFGITIAERIDMRTGRALFLPLLALGISSVLYWRHTEAIGKGDVRFYFLIQFFPMLAVPVLLLIFPARYTRTADLAGCLAWYALAKAFELGDARVFAAAGIVGGHTLKHLAGALATVWLLRMVILRRPLAPVRETRDSILNSGFRGGKIGN